MRDLNAFIFKYTSVSVMEEKFDEARQKYGHCAATLKFIDSLYEKKEKLCRAFTQDLFSFNATTTQRGEGYNDRLKGHTSLKAKLSDASLPELIDRFDAITLDTCNKALESLTKVRQNDDRVTESYKTEVGKSLELSALSVKSCEKVEGSEAQYLSTRTNGEIFVVDLKTKIMHRGEFFAIPTCSCGYYCSSFRICRDIVKALVVSSELPRSVTIEDLIVPANIHPFHLAQFHPMWPQAVRKANRADYDDLPQIKRILGGDAVDAPSPSTGSTSTDNNGGACPDEFYTYKGNKKVPPTMKARYAKLNEVFKKTADFAVNKGNKETYQHFHARLLQCQKELMDMITKVTDGVFSISDQIPLPPSMSASNKAQRRKDDATNNSRLNTSSSSGTKKAAKKRQPKKQQVQTCPQCELLVKEANLSVPYNDHSYEQCPRVDLFKQYIQEGKSKEGTHEAK